MIKILKILNFLPLVVFNKVRCVGIILYIFCLESLFGKDPDVAEDVVDDKVMT